MRQLRRPHQVPRPIVDHRQPRRFGPRIELQPQRLWLRFQTRLFQDQREGCPMQHRCLPMREQLARMHRTLRPSLLVYNEYQRQSANLLSPLRSLPLRGGSLPRPGSPWVSLVCLPHCDLNPIPLVNDRPQGPELEGSRRECL
jgi:hypothetical protein